MAVSKIFPEAIKLNGYVHFIPDEWVVNNKKVQREYMWAILFSEADQYVDALIKDCRAQRVNAQINRIHQPQ